MSSRGMRDVPRWRRRKFLWFLDVDYLGPTLDALEREGGVMLAGKRLLPGDFRAWHVRGWQHIVLLLDTREPLIWRALLPFLQQDELQDTASAVGASWQEVRGKADAWIRQRGTLAHDPSGQR